MFSRKSVAPPPKPASFRDAMREAQSGVKASGDRDPFLSIPGQYLLAIRGMRLTERDGVVSIIVSLVVVDAKRTTSEEPHSIGMLAAAVFQPLRPDKDKTFARLWREFLHAINGSDDKSVSDDEISDFGISLLMDPQENAYVESPAIGKCVECLARRITTKARKEIVATKWHHVEESEEAVAEQADGIRAGTWPATSLTPFPLVHVSQIRDH